MPYRRIHTPDGLADVWEEPDPADPSYESRSTLNADGWLLFCAHGRVRALRLYPREWCELPEQRLRELYRRARPRH
ncbi:MAG TPA: hypothetical protein VK922_05820 [Gemmatimonadaceae bacterium]|nr:hypothetical protein [Gemmatimonadaceae bacterium]